MAPGGRGGEWRSVVVTAPHHNARLTATHGAAFECVPTLSWGRRAEPRFPDPWRRRRRVARGVAASEAKRLLSARGESALDSGASLAGDSKTCRTSKRAGLFLNYSAPVTWWEARRGKRPLVAGKTTRPFGRSLETGFQSYISMENSRLLQSVCLVMLQRK